LDSSQSHISDNDNPQASLDPEEGSDVDIPINPFKVNAPSSSAAALREDEEEEMVGGQKLSELFCHDRLEPILLFTAQLTGLECLEEVASPKAKSLMYGSLGAPKRNPPILLMPYEVEEAAQAARKAKRYSKYPSYMNHAFRVNEEEVFRFPVDGRRH
jgi:hypothetical protein